MLIILLALRTGTFLIWFLNICQKKARTMHCWKGLSNTSGGVITGDLANRFKVLNSLVSTVFTTWVRLISFELRWLINWPNCNIIKRNLPSIFRKYYPNCWVIIDCSKLFIETPSSLELLLHVVRIVWVVMETEQPMFLFSEMFLFTASGSSYGR